MTAYFSKVDAVEEPVAAVPWSEESVRGTETILVVEDDAGLRALLNMGLGGARLQGVARVRRTGSPYNLCWRYPG